MTQKDRWKLAIVAKLGDNKQLTPETLAWGLPGAVNVASDFYESLRELSQDGVIDIMPNGGSRATLYALSDSIIPKEN